MAGTVRVTSEGAYVEQGGASVRITSLGAYVEHGPPAKVYVTSLGAYVEYEPTGGGAAVRLLPALGVGN
jgi:hypothetical protein